MRELRDQDASRPAPTGALQYFATCAVIAAGIFAIDQLTKWLARLYLPRFADQSVPILGDAFRLTYVMNRGAAFGILQDQNTFFIVVSGVVIGIIVLSYRYSPIRSPLVNFALGLQLGGALGNLSDRLRLGYVVDFLDVSIWPVFNMADSAIVVGVAILAYHLLRSPDRPTRRRESSGTGPLG